MPPLRVATYNIHKGFSPWNTRLTVHALRDSLRILGADLVFLQEVQGDHKKHALKYEQWPERPQHLFLADGVWPEAAYGKNVVYDHGHHGNAILSRFPIVSSVNDDVTDLRFERRGMLHCRVAVPGFALPVHCVCVHLSLLARSRKRQMDALAGRLSEWSASDSPLIVAGDFNDWSNSAGTRLASRAGLLEAFGGTTGLPPRSFPVANPRLRLDRIYVRGFDVESAEVHTGEPWSAISDHAPLSAVLRRPAPGGAS